MASLFDNLGTPLVQGPGGVSDYRVDAGERMANDFANDLENSPFAELGRMARRTYENNAPFFGGESNMVTPQVAKEELKARGLDNYGIEIPETGISRYELDMKQYLKQQEIQRQSMSERPQSFISHAAGLAGSFAAQAVDPINVASAFVPIVPELRVEAWLAKQGLNRGGRAAVRAGVGAAEGAVGGALVEPINYLSAQQENRQYGIEDSFANIVFGGIIGGGLHPIGGAVYDWRMGRAIKSMQDGLGFLNFRDMSKHAGDQAELDTLRAFTESFEHDEAPPHAADILNQGLTPEMRDRMRAADVEGETITPPTNRETGQPLGKGLDELRPEADADRTKEAFNRQFLDKLQQDIVPGLGETEIRPPREDIFEVAQANFVGDTTHTAKMVPIDRLDGGVRMSDPKEAARVQEIADTMKTPAGYVERLIVDDRGRVIEGQHRLEALRQLGVKEVPVIEISDKTSGFPVDDMREAAARAGLMHTDQIKQIVDHAADAIREAGSVAKAREMFDAPRGYERAWSAILDAAEKAEDSATTEMTASEEFKRWFAGSQVVDENGNPLAVYHGTSSDFEEFNTGRVGGIFFTPDQEYAQGFGKNLTKSYLNIKNIADLTDPRSEAYKLAVKAFNDAGGWKIDEDSWDAQRQDGRKNPKFDPKRDLTWEILDLPGLNLPAILREAGYDGVKLEERRGRVDPGDRDVDAYMVFSPQQIRSENTADMRAQQDVGRSENRATFRGKPFWSGAFDPLDGHIIETHPFEKAEAADFHHSFYFSAKAQQLMSDGRAQFFWLDDRGQVQTEWREAGARPDIVNAIKSQIEMVDDGEDFRAQRTLADQREKTDTPEFKQFFRHSEVVDDDGKPMVVYHGTASDIRAGDKSRMPMWFSKGVDLAHRFIGGGRRSDGRIRQGSNILSAYLSIQKPLNLTGLHNGVHTNMTPRELFKLAGVPADKMMDAAQFVENVVGASRRPSVDGFHPYFGWSGYAGHPTSAADFLDRGMRTWELLDNRGIIEFLKSKGYDGVMAKEFAEVNDNLMKGMRLNRKKTRMTRSLTYAIFEPEQMKSAYGNSGAYDLSNADITAQRDLVVDDVESPNFKTWSSDLPVVDDGIDYQGGGAVFNAYHGTTHGDITVFKEEGYKGSYLGQGPYMTTSKMDASSNYAGEGPDLTQRIDMAKDRVLEDMEDEHVAREIIQDYLDDTNSIYKDTDFDTDYMVKQWGDKAADHEARKRVKGNTDGLVMPVFVKLENPADTTGKSPELTRKIDFDEQGNPIEEEGTLTEWIEATMRVSNYIQMDAHAYIDAINEHGDSIGMDDLFQMARSYLDQAWDEEGDYLTWGGVFREIAKEAGYDGVIMNADLHFGTGRRGFAGLAASGMAGVYPGTLHIVPFKSENVKSSIGNNGDYSLTNADIRYQRDIAEGGHAPGTHYTPGERSAENDSLKPYQPDSADGTKAAGFQLVAGVRGSPGVFPASAAWSDEAPLTGGPRSVKIPGVGIVQTNPYPVGRRIAREWVERQGRKYEPITSYRKVDPARARRIAEAFDQMEHAPNDPRVKAAYAKMIEETLSQWEAIKRSGLQVEFIDISRGDPYANSPRLATEDVIKNNHLWVFSTDDGFGTEGVTAKDESDNPLYKLVEGETISGRPVRANDIFRIVHDYFGHVKDGIGFRADGEENAWRSHSRMYSPEAMRAMTTETRGQNSWVNYGPHGENNRTAATEQTIFAPQKIGLLPDWVMREGQEDLPTPRAEDEPMTLGQQIAQEFKAQRDEVDQTETPEFREWFGDSKVVDANGEPRVVYHGPGRHGDDIEFTQFSPLSDRTFTGGNWFSADPDYAAEFGNGFLMPVYLSIKKPVDLSHLANTELTIDGWKREFERSGVDTSKMKIKVAKVLGGAINGERSFVLWELLWRADDSENNIPEELKRQGFDGIIAPKENHSADINYVVFDPENVKSASGNRGTFDRNNPDIRFQQDLEDMRKPEDGPDAPRVIGVDAAGRPALDFRNSIVSHFTDEEAAADIRERGYQIVGDGYYGEAISFTPNREYGRQFGGLETNARIAPDARILNIGLEGDWKIAREVLDNPRYSPIKRPGFKSWREAFLERGIDGLYDAGAGDLFMYNNTKVWPVEHEQGRSGFMAQQDVEDDGILVWHSSPHDFDKFTISAMGTGEGFQAYGPGLYFAESEKVSGRGGEYWKQFWNKMKAGPENSAANAMFATGFDRDKAIERLESEVKYYTEHSRPGRYGYGKDVEEGNRQLAANYAAAAQHLRDGKIAGPRTYRVKLKIRPDELLDWDKRLADQPEIYKKLSKLYNLQSKQAVINGQRLVTIADQHGIPMIVAIKLQSELRKGLSVDEAFANIRKLKASTQEAMDKWHRDVDELHKFVSDKTLEVQSVLPGEWTGQSIVKGINGLSPDEIAQTLMSAGIKGVRYLDGASRNSDGWHITPPEHTVSGKWMVKSNDPNSKGLHFDTEAEAVAALREKVNAQTRNYAIFDDEVPDIIDKFQREAASEDEGIDAWHGSRHDFDRFEVSDRTLGTGEGAQVFSKGGYFGGARGTAEYYRDMLVERPNIDRLDTSWLDLFDDQDLVGRVIHSIDMSIENSIINESKAPKWNDVVNILNRKYGDTQELRDIVQVMEQSGWKEEFDRPRGKLYQVKLHVKPEELLDWDAPVSQAPKEIQAVFKELPRFQNSHVWKKSTIGEAYTELSGAMGGWKEAQQRLADLGIKGVKYLDQLSRDSGKGTSNYAIWDDSVIDIVDKFQRTLEEQPDLVAAHNLTSANLIHADRMGGIAAPSIAITRDSQGHDNFGEITLIAPKDLVDPQKGAKVFASDIYSTRYPDVVHDVKWSALKKLWSEFDQESKDLGHVLSSELSEDEIERNGNKAVRDSTAAMLAYARQKGIKVEGTLFDRESWKKRLDEARATLDEATAANQAGGPETDAETAPAYFAAREAHDRIYREQFAPVNELRRRLKDQFRNDHAFWDWADEKFRSLNPKEKIFKGFTNQGMRRYMPHTLDNVVKMMTKVIRDGEGFNYGIGNLRAKVAPQFKSIAAIRKARGRIIDKAAFDKLKDEAFQEFNTIADQLLPKLKYKGNKFGQLDALSNHIAEAIDRNNVKRVFDEYYNDITDDDVRLIGNWLLKLKDMPTTYFEVKLPRAVNIGEFGGAVVPSDMSPKVREILAKHGITNLREYPAGDVEARSAAINSFRDMKFQRDTETTNLGFYSAVDRALQQADMKEATGQHWLGWLKNKPGMKAEELEFTGLGDFLTENADKTLSKDQVLKHAQDNAVQLEETVYGETAKLSDESLEKIREAINALGFGPGQSEFMFEGVKAGSPGAIDIAKKYIGPELFKADFKAPKYRNLVLEGGENYREVLLRIPTLNDPIPGLLTRDQIAVKKVYYSPSRTHHWETFNRKTGNLIGRHPITLTENEAAEQAISTLRSQITNEPDKDFSQGHWAEKNVIAHARITDRIMPDGTKALHVEEVQSDWHQKGRKRGYRTDKAVEAERLAQQKISEINSQIRERQEALKRQLGIKSYTDLMNKKDLAAAYKTAQENDPDLIGLNKELENAQENMVNTAQTVPDGPFKKSWHELMMKRLIRYAAENGYDRILITPGEAQAERFSLSHQVSQVEYRPIKDQPGLFELRAYDKSKHEILHEDEADRERVRELIGTEMADRMERGEGWQSDEGAWRSFHGDDLKVGGEGMKGFYDKMLPDFMNKYGKKYGAKVSDENIDIATKDVDLDNQYAVRPTRYGWDVTRHDGMAWSFDSEAEANAFVDREINKTATVHSFPVTEQMRKDVMQGQPLFQRDMGAPTPGGGRSRLDFTPLSAEQKVRLEKLMDEIDSLIRKLVGAKVHTNWYDRIRGRENGTTYVISGGYVKLRKLIILTMESENLTRTAKHEAIHALKDLGYFTDAEWDTLVRAAIDGKWLDKKYGSKNTIRERYKNKPLIEQIEEAIAEEFSFGRASLYEGYPPLVRKALLKIKDFADGLGAAMRKVFGQYSTPEDIFRMVERGEMAERQEPTPPAQGPRQGFTPNSTINRFQQDVERGRQDAAAPQVKPGRMTDNWEAEDHQISMQADLDEKAGDETIQDIEADIALLDTHIQSMRGRGILTEKDEAALQEGNAEAKVKEEQAAAYLAVGICEGEA